MRKLTATAAMAIVSVALLLTGCAKDAGMNNANAPANGGGNDSKSPAPSAGTLSVGQTGDFGGLKITVKKVETDPNVKNSSGSQYVLVNVVVDNQTKELAAVNGSNYFHLIDPDGKSHTTDFNADQVKDQRINATLKVGEKKEGWVGFTVPKKAGNYDLKINAVTGAEGTFKLEVK